MEYVRERLEHIFQNERAKPVFIEIQTTKGHSVDGSIEDYSGFHSFRSDPSTVGEDLRGIDFSLAKLAKGYTTDVVFKDPINHYSDVRIPTPPLNLEEFFSSPQNFTQGNTGYNW